MSDLSPSRGSAPVGLVEDLGRIEAQAVCYLRLWSDGSASRLRVRRDLSRAIGPEEARVRLSAFDTLCDLCLRHARRPLMRHHVACPCLGADESCFANLIAAAAAGEHEDAMLFATMLVRPDVAPMLVGLAADVGQAFSRTAVASECSSALSDRPTMH